MRGGGNQSLPWLEKERSLFSFLLGRYPFKMYAQQKKKKKPMMAFINTTPCFISYCPCKMFTHKEKKIH